LDESELLALLLKITLGVYKVGTEQKGNFILGEGWSSQEEWGVWSQDKTATLTLPCGSNQFYGASDKFLLSLRVGTFGKQGIKISGNKNILWEGSIQSNSRYIDFSVPAQICNNVIFTLYIDVSNPTSPQQLGQSNDARKLGLGIYDFQIKSLS
jgi:hypothetical protein